MITKPFRDYNSYLREQFGCRVQKITLDAGLTCPNRDGTLDTRGCIYCNERGSGSGASRKALGITRQIEEGKAYLGRRYKAGKFLAYFQSFSNTYAPLPVLRRLYEEALSDPDVVGLSIGTRPDCASDEVLDYLASVAASHMVWIEYGLQSANDATLARIRRGHDVAAFTDAVARTKRRGIPVCVHVILGLPGERMEDMLRTARFIASQGVDGVKIHLLYVVRGTTLEEWYSTGRYVCLSREEYAAAVGEFLALLPPDVIIQRLTADPHPQELIAPAWAMEKQKNLHAIVRTMEERGLVQGRKYINSQ